MKQTIPSLNQGQQGKKKKYYHFKLQQLNGSNSMLLKEIVVTQGEGGDLLNTVLA